MRRLFLRTGFRLLPGGIAALVMGGLLGLGFWNSMEQLAYLSLFQLRGPTQWDDRLVVIGIDDQSLAEIGQFPWSRQRYVELLQRLTPSEPSVIAFDLIFADPSPIDEELATAMAQQKRVVLAQAWDRTGAPILPRESLTNAAIATGHIHKQINQDGLSRSIQPYLQEVPALAIAIAEAYEFVHGLPPESSLATSFEDALWINWPGPTDQASYYSFTEVLSGEVPPQQFKDKVIVVGATATGMDTLFSPYDLNPPTSGVYLHLAALNNLLQQNFLKVLPLRLRRLLYLLILGMGGPGLSLWLNRQRVPYQVMTWIGLGILWGSASLLLFHLNYWIPVVWPIALLFLTGGLTLLLERLQIGWLLSSEVHSLRHTHQSLPMNQFQNSRKMTSLDLSEAEVTEAQPGLKAVHNLIEIAEALSQQARLDGLTQLANRRYFDQRLAQAWQESIHQQSLLSLILCDIDFFKRYNDFYGHQAGDVCLQQVSGAMGQAIRPSIDLLARYGGEEFAVILPEASSEIAVQVGEDLRVQVRNLNIPHTESLIDQQVTLSVGVATIRPEANSRVQTLIQAADQALYQAKAQGRDRVALHNLSAP